ncbi:MAG: hypothetical protein ACRD1B_08780 [Thermoanaerobaculia bacterium]
MAGTVAVQALSKPLIRTVVSANVPEGWSDAQVEQALDRLVLGQNIGLFAAPFLLVLKLLAIASILFLLLIIRNDDSNFRKLFSLVSIASLLPLAASWLSFVVLTLRPAGALRSLRDLQPPIGLAVLAPNASLPILTLLNNLNPFECLYLLIVATGITRFSRISRLAGFALAISVWGLCVAAQVFLVAAVGRPR